jgi:hypothetical protein
VTRECMKHISRKRSRVTCTYRYTELRQEIELSVYSKTGPTVCLGKWEIEVQRVRIWRLGVAFRRENFTSKCRFCTTGPIRRRDPSSNKRPWSKFLSLNLESRAGRNQRQEERRPILSSNSPAPSSIPFHSILTSTERIHLLIASRIVKCELAHSLSMRSRLVKKPPISYSLWEVPQYGWRMKGGRMGEGVRELAAFDDW